MCCCPRAYVGAEISDVIGLAELYEKGLPPISGGVLDQSEWFADACGTIWADQSYWKRRLGIIG